MNNALSQRLQFLEEKFEYQERTIDALNDVILDQQTQINNIEDQVQRLRAYFSTQQAEGNGSDEPPPPHY